MASQRNCVFLTTQNLPGLKRCFFQAYSARVLSFLQRPSQHTFPVHLIGPNFLLTLNRSFQWLPYQPSGKPLISSLTGSTQDVLGSRHPKAKHWCAGMTGCLGLVPAEFRDAKYIKEHGACLQREELTSLKCQLNTLLRNNPVDKTYSRRQPTGCMEKLNTEQRTEEAFREGSQQQLPQRFQGLEEGSLEFKSWFCLIFIFIYLFFSCAILGKLINFESLIS